mmetsp:Transcript_36498/g.107795  ORF Transcript_36498/g.107795 Transcript_36498/m.107795 type:complete len:106 (+) Transcript_36498:184-501(+)
MGKGLPMQACSRSYHAGTHAGMPLHLSHDNCCDTLNKSALCRHICFSKKQLQSSHKDLAAAEACGVGSHGRVARRLHSASMLVRLRGFDRCAKLSPCQNLVLGAC